MNGESTYWYNPLSGVVHHFLCTATKGADLVPLGGLGFSDQRPCKLCLPDGLPQRTENPA